MNFCWFSVRGTVEMLTVGLKKPLLKKSGKYFWEAILSLALKHL